MATISTEVEFYQGSKGPLFRLIRTPEQVLAHLLFIAPLFEQANQTRHHITRSAINAYHLGIQTIIFDHYGTGDSSGELINANLALWRQDILLQLQEIKVHSCQTIYLSLPLSAVLLLSDEILAQVDGVMLLQPDFNGKRFVQQFKRLALVADLSRANNTKKPVIADTEVVDIAGYQLQQKLLDELAEQSLTQLAGFTGACYWFEWQVEPETLSPDRIKQQQALFDKNNKLAIHHVADVKFWQASELQIAQSYLTEEQLAFSQLLLSKGIGKGKVQDKSGVN